MDDAGDGVGGFDPAGGDVGDVGGAQGAGGPPTGASTQTTALVAFAAVALVVLVVGLIVWVANRGGDDVASDSVPSTGPATTPSTIADATTTTSTTTSTTSTTTTTSTTSTTTSTVAPSTAPPTTEPPGFALPDPGAATWTVSLHTGDEITLGLAASDDEIAIYDGVADPLRCVGVVGPGEAFTAWCGEPGAATVFVADRGLEPVTVELGEAVGAVTFTRQPAGWTLAGNGCGAPVATLLGAIAPFSHPVTSIVCADDEAFVGFGSALFGPNLAPDGGGALVAAGDEGWALVDMGTSIPCDGWPDEVDRCALFGVESELFEALLPVPPPAVVGGSALDVSGVEDRSSDAASWIGDETDPETIASILREQLDDPDAEVPAQVRVADALPSGRFVLVVIEIPQFDDAVRSETWAVWVRPLAEPSDVTAFRWATCARGVTGDGSCV